MEDYLPDVENIDDEVIEDEKGKPDMLENGIHVVSSYGHVFHKGFVETYRGMTFYQASKKLNKYYTKGPRKEILRFLRRKSVITPP
jgi:hypothetical protein